MLQTARRVILISEGKAISRLRSDEALEKWQGFEAALALVGLKLALELRRRGQRVPLEFFALRAPKSDFELPDWLSEDEDEAS